MNLVLDTHVLIWWLGSLPMLSANARDVVADPENEVFVSSASALQEQEGSLERILRP